MSDAKELRARLAIVASTLRYGAWSVPEENRAALNELAAEVERSDAESLAWACPVCEETRCDEGCPLADVRAPLIAPDTGEEK